MSGDQNSYFESHFWRRDPTTLFDSCMSYVNTNFATVSHEINELFRNALEIQAFPVNLFDKILCKIRYPEHLQLLRNFEGLRVTALDLNDYPNVTDADLGEILSRQKLLKLSINSKFLTHLSLQYIHSRAPNLEYLSIGKDCKSILNEMPPDNLLKKLKLFSFNIPTTFPMHLFRDTSLKVLDLSDSAVVIGLQTDPLHFTNLTTLSLHNTPIVDIIPTLEIVSKLKLLRKLDVGRSNQEEVVLYSGDISSAMKNLVSCLVQLKQLEVCGTNLPGMKSKDKMLAIDWLDDGRRLSYLGLLNCAGRPCDREEIPAEKVGGDCNVEQILTSLESYSKRPALLQSILFSFINFIRVEPYTDIQGARGLEYILTLLDKHKDDDLLQYRGVASIFYLIKGNLKSRLTTRIRRHIIGVVLDAMEATSFLDPNMCRNGCLILCHFRIPQDLIHDYARIVTLLLRIIEKPEPPNGESFLQRVSLNLLNSLACQVDNKEKLLVGSLRTFEVMLNIINKKLETRVCDEIMVVAWSLMWNATDETAPNCEQFISNGGLQMFMKCYETFRDKEELLRNMMGLMGNVAEVDYLKHHLITPEFVPTFRDLLDSESDGIEVSYNSCGILANLMFNGPASWRDLGHHWPAVQMKMKQAMARWPMTSERNINYRSFGPILRLLDCTWVPEVQQWALWALCNLTKVYGSKYCPLLKEENGIDKLIEVIIDTQSPLIRGLAAKVIRRCNRHEINPEAVSDAEDDDLAAMMSSDDSFNRDKGDGSTANHEKIVSFEIEIGVNGHGDISCRRVVSPAGDMTDDVLDFFDTKKNVRRGFLRSIYRRNFYDVDDGKHILKSFLKVLKK